MVTFRGAKDPSSSGGGTAATATVGGSGGWPDEEAEGAEDGSILVGDTTLGGPFSFITLGRGCGVIEAGGSCG